MNPVFKIAKAGVNAETSTDPNDFIFHSDYNTFKIISQNKTTITTNSGSNTYTIPHGATRTPPLLVIFIQFPDGKVTMLSSQLIDSYNNAENGGDSHNINSMCWDDTNIYIYVASVVTGYDISVVWYELEPELS